MIQKSFVVAALLPVIAGCASVQPADADLAKIEHIVVIYAENRSFDNLYGLFPGANGIANATSESTTQLDRDGKPLPVLPPVWKAGKPDPAFPMAVRAGPAAGGAAEDGGPDRRIRLPQPVTDIGVA